MPRAFLVLLTVLLLAGCGSRAPSPEFEVATGRYAAAFDAAREVLRDYRFQMDRVDARAGVISTQPKHTAGLASPWDREQSTLGQEVDDLLNNQSRVVRITFEDAAAPGPDVTALGPVRGRVEVAVYRRQSPGVRVPSKAVGMTTTARNPQAAAMGTGSDYEAPVSQDSRLAVRLAAAIQERLLAQPAR